MTIESLPRNRAERDENAYEYNADDKLVDRRAVVTNTKVNPIPVEVVDDGSGGLVTNVYGEINALASNTLTTIAEFTVPVDGVFYLKHIEASGSNKAEFTVDINASVEAFKRSYFTKFNVDFPFHNLKLLAGDVVKIQAEHKRTETGDFEARILGNLT